MELKRKIIGGKKYDTETAQEIGSYSNGGGWGDFRHYEETLYKKRTGEYFLAGEGGPASKYAEPYPDGGWEGGEKILPLNWEKARQWGEDHMSTSAYEKEFGEVSEDDSKRTVGLSLTAANVDAAKRIAAQRGLSLSALVDGLLEGLK